MTDSSSVDLQVFLMKHQVLKWLPFFCRRMATTQFEAYGARQAFPCFDEPRFKTNYTFTLGRPSNLERYTTIANGALKEAGVPQ